MFSQVMSAALEHIYISLFGVVIGFIISLPLGIACTRAKRLSGAVLTLADILQTIPGLALMTIIMMLTSLGNIPVIIAITLYSLLPITRNTYEGILLVDGALKEAGRGMGMTFMQLLLKVELPLSLPVIIAGIRMAIVTALGVTTTGVLIGAGGLGRLIWEGLRNVRTNMDVLILGSVSVAVIAIIANLLLGMLEKRLTRRSLTKNNE